MAPITTTIHPSCCATGTALITTLTTIATAPITTTSLVRNSFGTVTHKVRKKPMSWTMAMTPTSMASTHSKGVFIALSLHISEPDNQQNDD
jgi:hypothetical protein